MKKQLKNSFLVLAVIATITLFNSCDQYEPIGENSIPDATPPNANFSYTQGSGTDDEWKDYTFANGSTSATTYMWDFGNGDSSTDIDGETTYPGEGSYDVTLTASDDLGAVNTITQTVVVVEPEEPEVPNPTLVNSDFNKLPKSSGSDCSCAAWINTDIGEQGESSSGNGGTDNVVKFDNNEPDHVYQEFEVVPNAEYSITIVTSFKEIADPPGSYPGSMLELRVLAGSGYTNGYTPVYYSETVDFPQNGFGYDSITQVEEPANNILYETIENPDDDGYYTHTFTFNAGANNSLALFIRGIGGDNSGDYGYNSGDEEIRADFVSIIAN